MEWIKSHRKILIEIGIFLFFFVAFFLLNMFRSITGDEIWCYGFSYNISNGLTIYKDFNAVPTPFSFFLGSFFIKMFGPHFLSILILDSILAGLSGVFLYRLISWKAIFTYIPVFFISPSPYNLLCLFFLIWILYLISDDKKNYDLFIAFLTGLVFMSKQNIGVLMFLPMFFYSKKKVKSVIVFLIPFFVISLYFIFKGAFFDFIDYCFLGLFDFQENNTKADMAMLVFEIIMVIYLSFSLLLSKFKDKETFYILAFQIMTYPIIDQGHFFVALMPVFYYFSKKVTHQWILYPSFMTMLLFCCCYYTLVAAKPHMENDFMFMRAPDELVTFSRGIYDYFDGDIRYVFGNSEEPYFLKLLYDVPIGKFELLNSGNLGRNKEKTFNDLKELCSREKCCFLIFDNGAEQFAPITKLVKDNYSKVGKIDAIDIYCSQKS